MSAASPSSYDVLVYHSLPFFQTHPDLLRTLAGLFGIEATPVERCRVLELGCAGGGNIIPLAAAWPESQFLGIDYSARQVEMGQTRLHQLGLGNVELRHASILDVDESYGMFDYILCHGVYSWVPEEVQDGILGVCARNLKPDGVAYVSYNTLPGWHMRGMIREMMCYHDAWHRQRPPLERVGQARALLQFLGDAVKGHNTPYGLLLRQELELLGRVNDGYIFHEHLEEHNAPVYFFEFNERLVAHKLRFLGEADFRAMVHENLPPEIRQRLSVVAPNLIQMEQYLDFISNRMFRQSLICHEHHRPSYALSPEKIRPLLIASTLRPAAPGAGLTSIPGTFTIPSIPSPAVPGGTDLRHGVQQNFATPGGLSVSSGEPLVKAALLCLADAWPQAVPFLELCQQARQRLGAEQRGDTTPERDALELGSTLLKLYAGGGFNLVEFWRSYPRLARRAGDRPVATPLVRLMAREENQVANLRHQVVTLGDFDRQVLPLLDGSLTRAALRDRLLEAFRRGEINLARAGVPVREEHQARPMLVETLDQQLKRYAENALLLA